MHIGKHRKYFKAISSHYLISLFFIYQYNLTITIHAVQTHTNIIGNFCSWTLRLMDNAAYGHCGSWTLRLMDNAAHGHHRSWKHCLLNTAAHRDITAHGHSGSWTPRLMNTTTNEHHGSRKPLLMDTNTLGQLIS